METLMREQLARLEHTERVRRAERRGPLLAELKRSAQPPAAPAECRRFPFRFLTWRPSRA